MIWCTTTTTWRRPPLRSLPMRWTQRRGERRWPSLPAAQQLPPPDAAGCRLIVRPVGCALRWCLGNRTNGARRQRNPPPPLPLLLPLLLPLPLQPALPPPQP
ncbi:hypothetical protein FJT64_015575 [Amphibalanus amphitrite]|uniref:Uncharacterized protein n=1 Tax=Amphibalanus amphitrite TaxID=1232801 RepID=A0A6A4XC47_AMPAM|nr:hypothetical protein FJT64_015575 [Amphibalanus amphitrite]